jgi:hypothetical protein
MKHSFVSVDADFDEPAEQQVVFQPLHQKPLGADRSNSIARSSFSGGIDGRPIGRIESGELALPHRRCLVHDRPDRSQRMITPHPRLQINVAKQLARSAHAPSPKLIEANESWSPVSGERLLQ